MPEWSHNNLGAEVRAIKIVVTGAYGFVGSHLVERLLADGHKVTGLDNMSNGTSANLARVTRHMDFNPVRADISSKELGPTIEGADAMIHLAALTGESQCHGQPQMATLINVNGTVNLLGICVAEEVKRFVFASSAAVYGQQNSFPLQEDMTLNPTTLYGATKAAGEMYAKAFAGAYGLEAVALRFASLYGPRRNPAYPVAVLNFALSAVTGRDIVIYGSGEQRRNFTHVSDAVEGIMLALTKGRSGEAYNIANQQRTTVSELAEMAVELARKNGKEPQIRHEAGRVGDRDAYVGVDKAFDELGFSAEIPLEEGFPEFVQWVRSLT